MFSKRLLYFSATDAAPKFVEDAGKNPESQKTPEQQMDADRQKFQAKVDQVKQSAQQYLKDANPTVQMAAKEALAKIDGLEHNPVLDKKAIEAELAQINKIAEFVDISRTVEDQKTKLSGEREKGVRSKSEQLSKASADLLALHPELLRNSNATILLKRLEAKYADNLKQSMNVPISADLPVAPGAVKLSIFEHIQDPGKTTLISTELGSALTFDRSFDHDMDAKMVEFKTESDALAAEYLSKLPEESVKYVSAEVGVARARLEASDVYNKTQLLDDLSQLESGTLGNLELTKHAGEDTKRAMIMANFKDSLNQLVGKALADDLPENVRATKDLIAKKLKISPDQIGKLFEQQGVTLNQIDGISSESKYQITATNVQIRNLDGTELSYLNKNQKVQILDGGVYSINDAYKIGTGGPEAYRYYRVRLEPQGAVGLVEAKYVNFEPKVRQGNTVLEKKDKPIS